MFVPHLTSMEGMIWNANQTLTHALHPGIRGIPKGYFMSCAGICIIHTIQAGFMFSGSVGTGIFMKRDDISGEWSNPVACAVAGVGVGILMGANVKDIIVFLPDQISIETFFSKGVQMSTQSNVTVGVGREFDGTIGASMTGGSIALSIAFTKGAYVGVNMEGAFVTPRKKANEAFYGAGNDSPADIISGKIPFPVAKVHVTMIVEVKEKLSKLAQGLSEEVVKEEEKTKAEAAAKEAHKVSESLRAIDQEIIHMDVTKPTA